MDMHVERRMNGSADNQTELIRTYLADRTIGCPVCHYNLRGAAGSSCPECGTRLQLHINTLDVRLGPWLLGVIAVAMPLGFSLILGLTAAFGAWRAWSIGKNFSWYQAWTRFDSITLASLSVLTLFYSSVLTFVIRRRSKFIVKPRFEQWLRSITLTLIMAAMQVGLLYWWGHSSAQY